MEFTDHIFQLNTAVENGRLTPTTSAHYHLSGTTSTPRTAPTWPAWPTYTTSPGIYAGKTASLEELQDGAQIGAQRPTNGGGRALLLLQEQGLITLEGDVDIVRTPTTMDIRPTDRGDGGRPAPRSWAAWTLPSSAATTPSRPI